MKNKLTKLFVQLNEDCNFNCIHCINCGSKSKKLNLNNYKKALKKIVESKDPLIDLKRIMITGGEPTLNFGRLLKMCSIHKSLNLSTMLITNACLLDRKKILQLYSFGVDLVLISLNADNENDFNRINKSKGCFKKTIKAIKDMVDTGIKVRTRYTLMKENLKNLVKTYKLCESLNIDLFEIKVVSPGGNAKINNQMPTIKEIVKSYEKLFKNKKKLEISTRCFYLGPCTGYNVPNTIEKCGCGRYWLSITSGGDIYPCIYFTQKLGNIFQDDIIDIWKNNKILNIIRNKIPKKCKKCKLWNKCFNQCQGLVFRFTNKFEKTCFDVLFENRFLK